MANLTPSLNATFAGGAGGVGGGGGVPNPPPSPNNNNAGAAAGGGNKDRKMASAEHLVLDLSNPDLRENALLELSKV